MTSSTCHFYDIYLLICSKGYDIIYMSLSWCLSIHRFQYSFYVFFFLLEQAFPKWLWLSSLFYFFIVMIISIFYIYHFIQSLNTFNMFFSTSVFLMHHLTFFINHKILCIVFFFIGNCHYDIIYMPFPKCLSSLSCFLF